MERLEIPGYRVGRLIGEGGMARVFHAVQVALDRAVALKVLRAELAPDADHLARFGRECRTLAALKHPNVLEIYDTGSHGGIAWYAMELFDGATLAERMDRVGYPRARLPLSAALAVIGDVLAGLEAVHARGIVHRDVKPTNVFVHTARGAMLGDFGLVKELSARAITNPGETVGTIAYMAPEQATGGAIGPATDLYAVGVMLHELIAGEVPFRSASPAEVMRMHVQEPAPPVSARARETPPAVVELVRTALAKSPPQRFESAAAMRRAVLVELEKLRARPDFVTVSAVFAPDAPLPFEAADAAARDLPTGASLVPVAAAPAPRRLGHPPAPPPASPAAAPALPQAAPPQPRRARRARRAALVAGLLAAALISGAAVAWRLAGRPGAVLPELSASGGGAAAVAVEGLEVVRGVDFAELSFRTALPVLGRARVRGSSGEVRGEVVAQRDPAPATSHRLRLGALGDGAYTAQLAFGEPGRERVYPAEIPVPSLAVAVRDAADRAGRFDTAKARKALLAFRGVSYAMTPEQRDAARRALGPVQQELGALARRVVPVSGRIFGGNTVSLTSRLKVYDVVVMAELFERFGGRTGIDLTTGFAAAERGAYTVRAQAALPAESAVRISKLPYTFIAVEVESFEISIFGNLRHVEMTAELKQVARIRQAELCVRVNRFPVELYFEALINATAPLAFGGRTRVRDRTVETFAVGIDPALLVEGTNRVGLTLRQVPGLMSLETPWVERVELRVAR